MMIEPPGQLRRTGILKVNDGVFVAVKQTLIEELRRAMRQAGVGKFRLGMNRLPHKAREDGGRGGSVKAPVVKKNM
jgi:hypothetical protein